MTPSAPGRLRIGWRIALIVVGLVLSLVSGVIVLLLFGLAAMSTAAVNEGDTSTNGVVVAVAPGADGEGAGGCVLTFTYTVDGVAREAVDREPAAMDACDAVVGETIPVRIDAESGAASYDPAPALEALFAWIGRLWIVVGALAAVGVAGIVLLVRAVRHNRRLAAQERAAFLPSEGQAGPGGGPAVS